MKVIIVEDELPVARQIEGLIGQYAKEHGEDIAVQIYSRSIPFLEEYNFTADLILFDIQMDAMTGMEAAKQLRKKDTDVLIAFITSLSRYAIEGYSVSAIDYIVKPAAKAQLFSLLDRAKRILLKRASESEELLLNSRGTKVKVSISSIIYIEVARHLVTFHTADGELESWGSIAELEQRLPRGKFSRCNACYLAALRHVAAVDGEYVRMDTGEQLKISRQRRKDFLADFTNYLGMKNV